MSRTSIVSIVTATLLAIGTACWLYAGEAETVQRPRVWPKPTPPPPASPIYHDTGERMPSEEAIERAALERYAMLEQQIERTLLSGKARDREEAFVFLLPELLQVEPERVVSLFARLAPGEPRDTLRTQVAQLWIQQDTPAAMRWLKSLDKNDGRAAALVAATELAPTEPEQARAIARDFDLDREEWVRRQLTASGH